VKELSFPYTRYEVSEPGSKKRKHVYRPVIPVQILSGKKSVCFDALVDSGADGCTFPGWVAKMVGKDVEDGRPKIFSGIGGAVLSFKHKVRLSVEGITFPMEAYFSHEWDDLPFGLLGQSGFFSRFDVAFSWRSKSIRLRKR